MEILFLLAAYLFGLGAQTLKLPPLVGYLSAGFLLAAFGIETTENLNTIANLGVVIMLFTVGLKIRFRNIFVKEIVGTGFIYTFLTTLLFAGVGYLIGYGLLGSMYVGLMLSFSSTVFTAKILDDYDDLGAYYGRIAIGILIIQDIVAVTVLGFTGLEEPSIWAITLLGLPILIPLLQKLLNRTGHGELMLVLGIALALSGAWLFQYFGMSDKLGALVVGILISNNKKGEELGKTLWGLKEAFLVAFFLNIGLMGVPNGEDFLLVGLFLLLLPLKGFAYFFLLKLFGLRNRTAFWSSSVLFCYSEFGLIAGAGAVSAGLINESVLAMMGLLVTISFVLLGILQKWMSDIYDRFFSFLDLMQPAAKTPDHLPLCIGSSKFLVVGMGVCGTSTYDYLKGKKVRVLGIDSDPNVILEHREQGRRVIYGNAIDKAFWQRCNLDQVLGISVCLPVMDEKVTVIKKLRKLGYKNKIDTYCDYDDEAKILKDAGASELVSPRKLTGESLGHIINQE
ncbi:MAG: cation:proton antiporter [Bacteroidales bacterium]